MKFSYRVWGLDLHLVLRYKFSRFGFIDKELFWISAFQALTWSGALDYIELNHWDHETKNSNFISSNKTSSSGRTFAVIYWFSLLGIFRIPIPLSLISFQGSSLTALLAWSTASRANCYVEWKWKTFLSTVRLNVKRWLYYLNHIQMWKIFELCKWWSRRRRRESKTSFHHSPKVFIGIMLGDYVKTSHLPMPSKTCRSIGLSFSARARPARFRLEFITRLLHFRARRWSMNRGRLRWCWHARSFII